MSSLSRELVFLILQFLDEEKFKETRVTKVEDNRYSMKIFFEIRKQKYLEALDRHDRGKAVEILVKDLKVFSSFNEELFKEITQLLTLENFRQNEQLSKYGDTKSARNIMLIELKKLIEANPLFRDKLTFPPIKASRLRTLINQSLNWQHQLCKNHDPILTSNTILPSINLSSVPTLLTAIPASGYSIQRSCRMDTGANPSLPHAAVASGPLDFSILKHRELPPTAPGMEYQADSEHLMKRIRAGHSEEVSFVGPAHHPNVYSAEDIPRSVVRTLHQGSNVMSLDFHPHQQTILLVGSRERISHKTFRVWDISVCSMPLQAALMKDATASVNRCLWSPDGSILGVAFSKHIVQTYAFMANGELRIDAHIGGVNDIAFSHPNKSLSIVWDAATGQRQYTFEGHDASVYSVFDYDAPGLWCTTMAYSADGTGEVAQTLFSCGTSKDGESHLVEWNETEGSIKRTYSGFRKRSRFWDMDNKDMLTSLMQMAVYLLVPRLRFNKEGSLLAVTTNDNGIRILANSDGQRLIRISESRAYENLEVLRSQSATSVVTALGSVPNVSGPLATSLERLRRSLLHAHGWPGTDHLNPLPCHMGPPAAAVIENSRMADVKPRISEDLDKVKSWKLADHHHAAVDTNSGSAVLALTSNGVHKLWKWQRTDRNSSERLAAYPLDSSVAPQLWQPANGVPMTNDMSESGSDESTACIALSKKTPMSCRASGGKVSLFNMMTFKVMTTFMPPPLLPLPGVHPQDNNIIAIGMEDSTIQIYNVRSTRKQRIAAVKTKLKGHQKKITGLAFSQTMNVLVSSGADAQQDGWEKRKASSSSRRRGGAAPSPVRQIQFHNDQTQLLVIHETQLSVYDVKLETWRRCRRPSPAPSTPATASSSTLDCDGAVGVFDADSLRLRCRISPSSYIPSPSPSKLPSSYTSLPLLLLLGGVYPAVVAAHPSEANQIALGMSDGGVHVVEPPEAEAKWGAPPPAQPQENGAILPPSPLTPP
ncbi:unnamed protein product [Spirodela intermedia]|uniref:CTLH domain-containing protein n=1 Tax=Spirodela intermedia TaxID=51605 RepID=A0ABN7EAM8_SPIIN|nr:unnamed protein product [Spirodela intermedia]